MRGIASGTAEGTRPVARQAAEATGDAVTEIQARDLITALDEAPLSRFRLRAVLASGMGFFTDAYDLFVSGSPPR